MTEGQRNFLIVLAIVIAAMFVPAVGGGLFVVSRLVAIAFVLVTGVFLLGLYQRNSDTIQRMDIGPRAALIGSGALLFVITLTGILVPGWSGWSSTYTMMFFVLSFACVFAMVWAWSQRTGW